MGAGAASIALVACMGATLPLWWGIGWALVAAAIAAGLARARLTTAPLGGWVAVLRPRGRLARVGVLASTVFTAVVLLAVAARGLAELTIVQPAAIAGLVPLAIAAVLPSRPALVRLAIAPAMVLAAVGGAAYEAQGPLARGWAESGPLHGIHPFQATAVVIDGYGPFDLPINDYVEPKGERGYDPQTLADAIERALHRIAVVHFADGPAQARKAFAEADAAAITTDAVLERLDRPAAEPTVSRIWVRSGTWGQRSRVQFVCPGVRDDPRGLGEDPVMRRMCPDKYANEASAGLSVTGRWPGYVEFRGNERVGLSRLVGATRSDDAAGERWILWERRIVAIAALVLVALASWRARARGRAGIETLAAPLGLLLLGLAVAALLPADLARGPVHTPSPVDARSLAPWLGALALPAIASVGMWRGPSVARRGGPRWPVIAAALALVGVAARSDLAWLAWGPGDGIAAAVFAMADAASTSLGFDVQTLASVIAATMAGLLACAIAHVLACVREAADATLSDARRPSRSWTSGWLGSAATVALAIALSLSRKTDAGLALIPAAMGVALITGSALRRLAARGPWPARPGIGPRLVHLGWTLLGATLVVSSLGPERDPVRTIYVGLGLVAVVLALAVVAADPVASPGDGAVRGQGP